MVHITSLELDNLEKLAGGGFGTIYKKDDHTAYKVYVKDMYDAFGTVTKNPSLKYPSLRLYLLRKKGDSLKYTDVFSDYLFVDGEFAGVVIPLYHGKSLVECRDIPIEDKIDISKQVVRNSKELTDHFIYPTDYKLGNILFVNGEVKFIDLDDILTKVSYGPNFLRLNEAIIGIGDTIYSFFYEFAYKPYSFTVKNLLLKEEAPHFSTYEDIYQYLELKKKKKSFLTIDHNSDLSVAKDFLSNHSHHVIFQCPDTYYHGEYYQSIIEELKRNGILLYDFVFPNEKDYLPYQFSIEEELELKGKQFVKKSSKLD